MINVSDTKENVPGLRGMGSRLIWRKGLFYRRKGNEQIGLAAICQPFKRPFPFILRVERLRGPETHPHKSFASLCKEIRCPKCSSIRYLMTAAREQRQARA